MSEGNWDRGRKEYWKKIRKEGRNRERTGMENGF